MCQQTFRGEVEISTTERKTKVTEGRRVHAHTHTHTHAFMTHTYVYAYTYDIMDSHSCLECRQETKASGLS